MVRRCIVLITTVLALTLSSPQAQQPDVRLPTQVAASWRTLPDLTYSKRHAYARLDLVLPTQTRSRALVALFHGGGVRKEQVSLAALPFLAAGFSVANIEYRMVSDAVAPAAVHDAVCATRWLVREAPADYRVAEHELVLTGNSAGGHLALMAGLANDAFGHECPHLRPVRPTAVINLFGVSDFDRFLFESPASRGVPWAKRWIGDNRQLARTMSPVRYVGKHSPPVLTIHGTEDGLVPIHQSIKLHEILDKAAVTNQLVSIAGGEHGGYWTAWDPHQLSIVEGAIMRFINSNLSR